MARDLITSKVLENIVPLIDNYKYLTRNDKVRRPFVCGITGLQGGGKSTLADSIVHTLNMTYGYRSVGVSLDDFYKLHRDREDLRHEQPLNRLLRTRGQPGTHDLGLIDRFFSQFSSGDATARDIFVPVFDKSLLGGEGDRLPESEWKYIENTSPIDVIVFEGWCLGFMPLPETLIEEQWRHSRTQKSESWDSGIAQISRYPTETLGSQRLEDLLFVNHWLSLYCNKFMGPSHLDCLVQLDSVELLNVYLWRLDQERVLRKVKGEAMSDERVIEFVRGYMPAYELYLAGLQTCFFGKDSTKLHLRIMLDAKRHVVKIERARY